MQAAWKVEPGSNVKLQDYDPNYVDEQTDPALARAELEQLGKELGELQELLAAAHHHSLLVVLQGMDTSGKADTIHQVLSRVNPQGCEVRSIGKDAVRADEAAGLHTERGESDEVNEPQDAQERPDHFTQSTVQLAGLLTA